jgi:hypothetical protein
VLRCKPRKGDVLTYHDGRRFVVTRTPENGETLCYIREEGTQGEALPFIWYFPRDGAFNNAFSYIDPLPTTQQEEKTP